MESIRVECLSCGHVFNAAVKYAKDEHGNNVGEPKLAQDHCNACGSTSGLGVVPMPPQVPKEG